ncbi:MAG TPA: response regulator [Polyangiales bacterium]|nr:response regulator [Polyangiales bacterium]
MTTLLIVEDSATQAMELSLLLEAQGFQVNVAKDGVSGLDKCRRFNYDAVLSDVVMPGIDGYELCRRLKADPQTANVPVILLTSLADPLDIIRGLECGADNFITKPYEPAYLLERVRRLLENKALRHGRKIAMGVDVMLMGKRFTINSEKEQMVDLLISTFEEVLRSRQREYEARLSEETVRVSHRFLQSALDALSTQIAIVDSSTTIVAANQRWRAFIETVAPNWPKAGVGSNYTALWQEAFEADAENAAKVAAGVAEVNSGARKAFSHQYTARIGNVKRWFTLTATRFEEHGVPLVAVEHEDETDRKQLEQQLLHSQKMEAIGQLAGGVAHDFNNLLLVIGGYADLLARSFEDNDSRIGDVAEITQAVKAASALTQQLLAFSRQQRLQPCVVDLNAVVSKLENMMRRLIGEDVEYTTALLPSIGLVHADKNQLQQILMNLVVNARDAMPNGGKIVVSTQNVKVVEGESLSAEVPPGDYVVMAVDDNGQGMDAATRARIFEPFFTTKEVGKGTGLGLSTVYGITRQSGGYVWVYSEPGQGTTFKIYLPRVHDVLRPASDPAGPTQINAERRATILIVEDNQAVRELIERVLSGAGYTVYLAGTPNEARDLCAKFQDRIDLMLTDVVMPDMSGPVLAQQLRAARPDMKLILMSGYSGATLQQRDGVSDVTFLEKPFSSGQVLRAVRAVLRGDSL